MSITNTLSHVLIPGHSNNFRAKILHSVSLLALSQLVLILFFTFQFLSTSRVAVLGYAANIPVQKVVELTNQKRVEQGVGLLAYNDSLAKAAKLKGLDMLAKGYWAHVSPTGAEPWDFFRDVGYTYRFAGENLARDFSSPEAAIEAWLASPSHRENMLSGKYTEIGVAVLEGDLGGKDTTLIIQLFGTPSGRGEVTVASAETHLPPGTPEQAPVPLEVRAEALVNKASLDEPIIKASSFDVMKAATIFVALVMVGVLALDIIIVSRRGITRVSGRAFAHLSFFVMVFIVLALIRVGRII